ncbi:MAG: hypothetical protein HZA15_11120 [Nitrospirae bacterium]|nr:hypothetical protein [Nitrospirota bacterium]
MPPVKHSRVVFFQEIAKGVEPRGTISHVSARFLQELKLYLSFSGEEIATLFGVSRPAVERKRKAAATEPPAQEPKQAPPSPLDIDIPPDFCDMATDDKIAYITRKYDRCIDGQESLTKEQVAALKARLEDLRNLQAEETREGKELISRLLNVIYKDWIRNFRTVFEASFSTLKNNIAQNAFNALCEDKDKLREMLEAEDATIIMDSILHKLQGIVAGLGTDFDPVQIFSETAKKHELIKLQIDRYLARQQHEKPRFVGGGSVAAPDSIQGGAQARQSAKEELRQQAANRMKAL